MTFVFDIDDTICETDEYSEIFISQFFKNHNLPYKKIEDNTRFAEQKFNWDRDTANRWYKKYGDAMMFNFPCKQFAVEIINRLYEMGHKIVLATARARDWHDDPETITKQWLDKVGLHYNKLYFTKHKELVCAKENADFFIDDDISLLQRVKDYFTSKNKKINIFMSTTKYNASFEEPKGVVRFKNFVDFIMKLQDCGIDLVESENYNRI